MSSRGALLFREWVRIGKTTQGRDRFKAVYVSPNAYPECIGVKLGELLRHKVDEQEVLDGLKDELVLDNEKITLNDEPYDTAAVKKITEIWDALEWVYLVYLGDNLKENFFEIYKNSYLSFDPSDLRFVFLVWSSPRDRISADMKKEMQTVHWQSHKVLDAMSSYHEAVRQKEKSL